MYEKACDRVLTLGSGYNANILFIGGSLDFLSFTIYYSEPFGPQRIVIPHFPEFSNKVAACFATPLRESVLLKEEYVRMEIHNLIRNRWEVYYVLEGITPEVASMRLDQQKGPLTGTYWDNVVRCK